MEFSGSRDIVLYVIFGGLFSSPSIALLPHATPLWISFSKPTNPSLCRCKILSQSDHFKTFDDVINYHTLMMMMMKTSKMVDITAFRIKCTLPFYQINQNDGYPPRVYDLNICIPYLSTELASPLLS